MVVSSSPALGRSVVCRVVSPLFREHIPCGLRNGIPLQREEDCCVSARLRIASGNKDEMMCSHCYFFFNLLLVVLVHCMPFDDRSEEEKKKT